jgi:peptide/nickel transport system ATP-binding protein/oligopeptide transport system ATP-binding protein
MDAPLLKLDNIAVSFISKQRTLTPVTGVTMEVPPGKCVGVVGESGCGKSITAMSIMGLLPRNAAVTGGGIFFKGQNLLTKSTEERRRLRGSEISMIFQEPMTALNPIMPVGNQILENLLTHSTMGRREATDKVYQILGSVGISDAKLRYHAYPFQLSGGLRQRIMIAIAMICKPALLIADEPTTALDVTIEAQILHLMRELQKTMGSSILMITHNFGVVAEICEIVYVMYAGQVIEYADVFELLKNPRHPYTKGLIRSLPSVTSTERLYTIRGTVPALDEMPQGCRFHPRCENATPDCRDSAPELTDTGTGHGVRCHCCAGGGK